MYKGKEGMLAWILHRVSGVGIFLFLLTHILDSSVILFGKDSYDKVMSLFHNPFAKTLEIGLFAAVLYHALNGIRIVIFDLTEISSSYAKTLFYIEIIVFVLIFIPVALLML